MNPHSYRLKGRDFVHQGKIEIDVNERAVFLSELKAAFSFTPTPIVSLTVYSRNSFYNREFHNVNCRFCGAAHDVDRACMSVLSQVMRVE